MARPRGGVNKSQMIREYLRENPGVRTKDVVEHFSSMGMDVSNQLVSTVRSKEGVSGGSEVRLSEVRSVREFVERSDLDPEVAVQILTSFADLVDNLGGTGRFRRVLSAYMECVDPPSEEDSSSEEEHEEDCGSGSSYIDVNEEEDD